MKGLKIGSIVALAMLALNGCAFLASKGVLSPEDSKALCVDGASVCSVANLVNGDENVRKACEIVAKFCTQPAE